MHTVKSPSPVPFRTSIRPAVTAFVNRFSFESSFCSSYEFARIDTLAARQIDQTKSTISSHDDESQRRGV